MATAVDHIRARCCGADDDGDDTHKALVDTIGDFYLEAVARLPIHDYPNLVYCMQIAGHCYGLLDPVSNILLHAIAHGPNNKDKMFRRKDVTEDFMARIHRPMYWRSAARRSLHGLVTFLMSFYRYLTRDQAVRYLALAEADIYFAVDLVERDFNKCVVVQELPPPAALDVDGGDAWIPRTEDAVTYAAMAAEHPEPDVLVKLATATFGADEVRKLAAWLNAADGDRKIDHAAVDGIYESMMYGRKKNGLHLYNIRVHYPESTDAAVCHQNLKTCIHPCPSVLAKDDDKTASGSDVSSPPSSCDYIKRIEALLVDYINALNLSAISRLSPDAVKALHRGLVVAGYLYGPFEDPVHNILVNAIWYQLNVPTGDNDNGIIGPSPLVGHTICTDLMLRNGFNALSGQVAFLCSKYGDTLLSGHDAMECLYSTNCNLVAAMELAELAGHHAVVSSSGDDAATEAAVKAMKHPRQDTMMALMDSFTPELEAELCVLLPAKGRELSCEAIDHISRLLSSKVILPAGIIKSPPAATTMHQEALAHIALEKRAFKRKQRFIREWIEFLLVLFCLLLIITCSLISCY